VVQIAREASQTAEDARAIAEQREHEEKLTSAREETTLAHQAKTRSEAVALRAQAEADVARQQADAERAARERAESEAAIARQRATQAEAVIAADRAQANVRILEDQQNQQKKQETARRTEFRMRLLEQLNGAINTRDTPRGLVATISDAGFNGVLLRGSASEQLNRIAVIVKAYPGLKIEVEGHSDSASTEALSWKRAETVRNGLIASGLNATARGLGATRPLTYNGTANGRLENRRVEIVISGDAIGTLPFWDRTYSLTSR
jgi:outer membrane protein OmpA-like peptidoglycan-associated protein